MSYFLYKEDHRVRVHRVRVHRGRAVSELTVSELTVSELTVSASTVPCQSSLCRSSPFQNPLCRVRAHLVRAHCVRAHRVRVHRAVSELRRTTFSGSAAPVLRSTFWTRFSGQKLRPPKWLFLLIPNRNGPNNGAKIVTAAASKWAEKRDRGFRPKYHSETHFRRLRKLPRTRSL